MNRVLFDACKNFADTLGLEIKKCESDEIKGYVSKVKVKGDINYSFYIVLPEEKLKMVSEILLGSDEFDLEDLTKEIGNLIIGNAQVIANEKGIKFDISIPEFLGEYNEIDYDDKICLVSNGVKFFVLYKDED